MSNIPKARQILNSVLASLIQQGLDDEADDIAFAVSLLYRRPPVRRMKTKSPRVTPKMKRRIVKLARTTNLHNAEIAARLKVNPGRISEVLQKHLRSRKAGP